MIVVATLFLTSCVSTKKIEASQEESKQNASNLDMCEEKYNTVFDQNKDLSKNIISLDNVG